MRTTTFQLSDLKRALIKMIDLKLKSYTVNGMILTKEQVTELIDDHTEIQQFKELERKDLNNHWKIPDNSEQIKLFEFKMGLWDNVAIFDDRLDRSEMFCQVIDSATLAYSVMQDDDQGYTVSWDFKVNLN